MLIFEGMTKRPEWRKIEVRLINKNRFVLVLRNPNSSLTFPDVLNVSSRNVPFPYGSPWEEVFLSGDLERE